MLQVRLRFFGPMHDVIAGQRSEVTMPQDATVGDLLAHLSSTYGEKFNHRVLTSERKPQTYVEMFVDGSAMDRENLDRKLAPEGTTTTEVWFYVLLDSVGG